MSFFPLSGISCDCGEPAPNTIIYSRYVNCFIDKVLMIKDMLGKVANIASTLSEVTSPCLYTFVARAALFDEVKPYDVVKWILKSKKVTSTLLPGDLVDRYYLLAQNFPKLAIEIPDVDVYRVQSGEYVASEHFNAMALTVSQLAKTYLSYFKGSYYESFDFSAIFGFAVNQDEAMSLAFSLQSYDSQSLACKFKEEVYGIIKENLKLALPSAPGLTEDVIDKVAQWASEQLYIADYIALNNLKAVVETAGSVSDIPCLQISPGYACFMLPTARYDLFCIQLYYLVSAGKMNVSDPAVLERIVKIGEKHVKSGDIVDGNDWAEVLRALKELCPTGECYPAVPICLNNLPYSATNNAVLSKLESLFGRLPKNSPVQLVNVNPEEVAKVNPDLSEALEKLWKHATLGTKVYSFEQLIEFLDYVIPINVFRIWSCKYMCMRACSDCHYEPDIDSYCGHICPLPQYMLVDRHVSPLCCKRTDAGRVPLSPPSQVFYYARGFDEFERIMAQIVAYTCAWYDYGIEIPHWVTDEIVRKCLSKYLKKVVMAIGKHQYYLIYTYRILVGERALLRDYAPMFIFACDRAYGNCLYCDVFQFPGPEGIAVFDSENLKKLVSRVMDINMLKELACLWGEPWFMYQDKYGTLVRNLYLGHPLLNINYVGGFYVCVEGTTPKVICSKQRATLLSL